MVFPVIEVDEGEIVALALRLVVLQMEEKVQMSHRQPGSPRGLAEPRLSPPLHAGPAGLA